ncbi:MAG: SgcJ/EcaC family oxidoreductase [Acidobacteriia bacterium]|nr:SgcJ/EcaC family oxidoreductase [Terriglobia bacterium]
MKRDMRRLAKMEAATAAVFQPKKTQIPSFMKIARFSRLLLVGLLLMSPALALAGPAEEANAAIDRWSASYNTNDPAAVANNYWPDAILLGTKSPVISTGTEAIEKYFTDLKLKGSGNKNVIQERHTIPIDDHAVLVTGFYEFTRMQEGKPVPGPSRFTMLVTKRGGEWRIAHHHSSPLVPAAK